MRYPRNVLPSAKLVVGLSAVLACLATAPPLLAQEAKPRLTLPGEIKWVRVAFSPDGKTLVSGGADNTIRFWDVAMGKEQTTLKKVAEYGVCSVAFSPDGKTLASGLGGNKVKLWDLATRKDTILLDKLSQYASPRVVFSPDGKTLASGGQCIREIRVFDVVTGKITATLKGHDEYGIDALAFTPDGKTLISVGGHEGTVKLWDVATGKETAKRKLVDWCPAAAVSLDSKTVVTAMCLIESINGENVVTDKSIKLWDVATGKELISLKGHEYCVSSVIFSPDGKTLATGDEEKTIKLWDVATGKELATLKGHTESIVSLTFSADGKMLASTSEDKTIKLWDVAKPK